MKLRVSYFDYLRVIAIFSVIFLHVSAGRIDQYSVGSNQWNMYVLYDSISRFCVPIFVMISGAIFLDPNYNISKLYKKNIFRLVVAYFTWSFLYALVSTDSINLTSIVSQTFKGHYHLWFLPMLIGLYISVPALRLIAENKKVMLQFMLVLFVFCFALPTVKNLIDDFGNPSMQKASEAIYSFVSVIGLSKLPAFFLYFSLGYFLHKKEVNKYQRRIIYGLGISSLVMGYILTKQASLLQDSLNMHYFSNSTLAVFFVSIMVFVLAKYYLNRSNKYIETISKYSFGMYLIHALFLDKLIAPLQISYPLAYVTSFLFTIVVFLLSFLTSFVGSKIPYVSKYIL